MVAHWQATVQNADARCAAMRRQCFSLHGVLILILTGKRIIYQGTEVLEVLACSAGMQDATILDDVMMHVKGCIDVLSQRTLSYVAGSPKTPRTRIAAPTPEYERKWRTDTHRL